MTFARALRAILRQDPDVVMIGEIRDLETAQIAVQASLTGHLVLATLHTNDAPGAVTRLIDMGIEPFLLASTPERRARAAPGAQALRRVQDAVRARERATRAHATRAVGCGACNFSGYRGRTGIYELLTVDDELRRLIHDTRRGATLREHAVRARHDAPARGRHALGARGRDLARRSAARDATNLNRSSTEETHARAQCTSSVLRAP